MFRFLKWRSAWRRKNFEGDMADEFAFHVQARTEDLIRRGVSPDEAQRRARVEFGARPRYQAECRESHRVHWVDEITRNGRYALRNLMKAPLFSLTGILSLAVGLAAVGIMFTVVDTVLLRALPFAHSERIVTISQRVPLFGSSPTVVTPGEFQAWQRSGVFECSALVDTASYTLEEQGRPERIYGASVTPDFFSVFGLHPIAGRAFAAEDAVQGRSNVIVLSYELWARDFGSDASIIGRTIHLSGVPMTVIGVMPAGFEFPRLADVSQIMSWAPEGTEFWTPFVITPKIVEEGNFNFYALGRLRPGVTPERAAAQLLPAAVHLFREQELKYPEYKKFIEEVLGAFAVYVTPLRETMAWGVRDALWMLLAAVMLLLVLVLFNLGNLLLTRNTQRLREYTVRQALGASRWQLFRESIVEQTVLVGLSSLVAGALTASGIRILGASLANSVPRFYELRFSGTEFAVLMALAFLTAVIFGALSQLVISQAVLTFGLNSQGRTLTSDRQTNRLRFLLIAGEIAVSAVLLVGAGLLIRSFQNVMREQPGFNPHNVLTLSVPFNSRTTDKPEKRVQHIRELIARIEALPGVESASIVNRLPLAGDTEIHNVHAAGRPVAQRPENISAEKRVIDVAYFRTMQIPLVEGRLLRADDPNQLVVINQQMAKRLWPSESPIDKRLTDGDNPPLTVIGVVGDVHYGSLEKPPMMQFYGLINADPNWADTFVVRSRQSPESLIPAIQKTISRLDASEPVTHAQTMEHLLDVMTLQRKFETALLSSFAAVALFLSAMGLFGVASLSATRRTREFGIRLAVGASGSEIVRLEVRRTVAMVVVGLGLGLIASTVVAQMMAGFLFRVKPQSGGIFAEAALVLIASALLAAWLPARRAARTDPAAALRVE